MQNPYLIQSGKIKSKIGPKAEGIDGLIDFSYMGAAEFEFGALPESLKRIREEDSDYFCYTINSLNKSKTTVTVLCRELDATEILANVEKIATRKVRLKGYCGLADYLESMDKRHEFNSRDKIWWDIENDYFFWVGLEDNEAFISEFVSRLFKKKIRKDRTRKKTYQKMQHYKKIVTNAVLSTLNLFKIG